MRLCKLALVVGVVALLASPALAQRGRGGRGGAGVAFLLSNTSVKEELKIDEDQAKKVKAAIDKVSEDNKDDVDKLRNRETKPEERTEIAKKLEPMYAKAVKDVLKEDQLKRLHQIRYQVQGLAMFEDEEVQKTLKLSDKQKDEIKDVAKDLQKERDAIFPPGQKPDFSKIQENMTKLRAAEKDAMTSAKKTLNDDQKKQLEELVGKPFEIKFEFGKPGGGKPGGDKPRSDF
jgi:hypothetical protein